MYDTRYSMEFITREKYIEQTLLLSENSSSEAYKAKYWELAGRALGYLDAPKIENQNIAVFQSISGEMLAFLKSQGKIDKEIEIIPTRIENVNGEHGKA